MKVKPIIKLNIRLYFFICISFLFLRTVYSQNNRIEIKGVVKYDAIPLQDINIINKTTNLGTSSDSKGVFKIPVKIGDSLLFSSIVYKNRIVKITATHITSKKIIVHLESDLNELDEIELRKIPQIDWSKASVVLGTIYNNDNNTAAKPPNAENFTNPISTKTGINFVAIFKNLTQKSRIRRKKEKQKLTQIEFLKSNFQQTIKNSYGTDFFTEWLKIPKDQIHLFLDFCEGKGLNELYDSDEFIVKNFLVKQSILFHQFKK